MNAFLILPTQLFANPGIDEYKCYIVEHPVYFDMYKYHKAKLIMHRYTMKKYYKYLKSKHIDCSYLESGHESIFKKHKQVVTYDPVDHFVAHDLNNLAKKYKTELIYIDNPGWISGSLDFKGARIQTNFYRWQRLRLGIFTNRMNPLTYDNENRKPFDEQALKNVDLHVEHENNDAEYHSAVNYVKSKYPSNPGEPIYWLPGDYEGAKKHLKKFFKYRLNDFGPYEDAINPDVMFGYHAVISPLLNIGLLTPDYIISEVLKIYKSYPFGSIEGFIRQIIGWREYTRLVYVHDGPVYGNRFGAKKPLPRSWYSKQKGESMIEKLITKTWEYGYLHHIERLMLVANFMTLAQFKPSDCYDWFMCAFLDSYHVFMETNLLGMSMNVVEKKKPHQLKLNWKITENEWPKSNSYMTQRMYICSSNYIRKMGWKLDKKDAEMIDKMYHDFLKRNKSKLTRHYPGALSVKN